MLIWIAKWLIGYTKVHMMWLTLLNNNVLDVFGKCHTKAGFEAAETEGFFSECIIQLFTVNNVSFTY